MKNKYSDLQGLKLWKQPLPPEVIMDYMLFLLGVEEFYRDNYSVYFLNYLRLVSAMYY